MSIDMYLTIVESFNTMAFYQSMLWMVVIVAVGGLALAPFFQLMDTVFTGRTVELPEWRRADNAEEIEALALVDSIYARLYGEWLNITAIEEIEPVVYHHNVEQIMEDPMDVPEPLLANQLSDKEQEKQDYYHTYSLEEIHHMLAEESDRVEEASLHAQVVRGMRALDELKAQTKKAKPLSLANYMRAV
jgi:hypothetical protein